MATTYPTIVELATFLADIGYTATISDDLKTRAINSAIEWVESYCARSFITSGVDESVNYSNMDVPSNRCIIPIKDTWEITTVDIDGDELTEGVDGDYVLLSRGDGWPFDGIEFLNICPCGHEAFAITGKLGFETVPASIQNAIMCKAASIIMGVRESASGGVVTSRKIKDRSISYGSGANQSPSASMAARAETDAFPYVKVKRA